MNELLLDRWKLIRALQDAVDRLALDRTDTRMLGFPETREERNGRALLEELRHQAPQDARSSTSPAGSTPDETKAPGGAS
jgi:hypothetical protein